MLANTNGKFEMVITQLLIDRRFEKAMERGLELYQIKQYKITDLPPNKIAQMYYLISTKFYYNRPPEVSESWHENELKVFIYLLVGYSYLQGKCISQMTNKDWLVFSQIFNHRNPVIFEFQGLSILKKNSSANRWDLDQVSLLDSIIRAKSIKNKWNEIARDLFIRSGKKFFKTAKQCREYWINHLDPAPIRSSWTASQDYDLLAAILEIGKKWAKVSKLLGGRRTEHMVKNRFKSLYHFQTKQRHYPGFSQLSEEEILTRMVEKYRQVKEEEIKLSNFEHNRTGHGKDEGSEVNMESGQSQEYAFGFNSLIKQSSSKMTEPEESAKQKLYFTSMTHKQIESQIRDLSLQDCINEYFEHDSFLQVVKEE